MNEKIPLFKIFWDENDIQAIESVVRSGKYWATGPQINEFENKIKDYLDAKHCITFNSGGSALFALMLAYKFKPGSEILVPSFTFIGTAYAPLYINAKPVFTDIEKKTFGLDPADVKRKITSKTTGIIPIHYGGMPCKIHELKEIAQDNNLLLLEDAAESFGAKYKDKNVGTFGDAAIFSFCHNKIFTTGEGGCVITDDDRIYERLKLVQSYGRVLEGDYFLNPKNLDYIELGHNFRLSSMSAALGISQLKKVDTIIQMRRKNAEYLNKSFKSFDNIVVPEPPTSHFFSVYQMYTIRILDGKLKRDNLMNYLSENGISSRIYFDPVHKYSVFKNIVQEDIFLPNTEELTSQVLTLPLYPHMSKNELDYIVNNVKSFFDY
ncbi:MAG: DegT/DnrJ/EryC1/StrS family aminotransferase [Promethearchaeota archaeon]